MQNSGVKNSPARQGIDSEDILTVPLQTACSKYLVKKNCMNNHRKKFAEKVPLILYNFIHVPVYQDEIHYVSRNISRRFKAC
jgi:hypothetical protein